MLPVLNFTTNEEVDWAIRGETLRRLIGSHLESVGYEIDYNSDKGECDWYFRARRGTDLVGVLLVLAIEPQQHWWIDLERVLPTKTQMPDCELRSSLLLQLEKCLIGCDYISDIELRVRPSKPLAPSRRTAWEVAWWGLIITAAFAIWVWVWFFRGHVS